MKINISLELDYIIDKDLLFFLSNEKLVTNCIKTMTVKKDKTDNIMDNTFDVIMNKGFVTGGIGEEEIIEDIKPIVNKIKDTIPTDSYIE